MMKYAVAAALSVGMLAGAQRSTTRSTLRTLLLQELRETHHEKNWFVSEKEAVAD